MRIDKKFNINYVDCSSLDMFSLCPFKFMLSRCLGVTEKDSTRIFLDYGKIIHECLPLCYEQELQTVWDKFNNLWSETSYGDDDDKRNTDTAHLLLENFWLNHYGDACPYEPLKLDITKVETDDIASEGEVPFLIDIGAHYPFAGRIDMPVRLKANNSIYALDYKTSSEVSSRFFDGFENHPQALGYSLALSVLTNEPVDGFIVEAVRVAKTPKRPSTVPPNQYHPINVPEHKLKWFIDWANVTSCSIAFCNEEQYWPKKPTGCCPYSMFGMPGFSCRYKTFCNLPEDKWQDHLRFYDYGDPWHPFKIDKENPESKTELENSRKEKE